MLDPREANLLTSREVAKIIGAQLSSLVSLSEPGALVAVIDHFAEHRDQYVEMLKQVEVQAREIALALAATSGDARA